MVAFEHWRGECLSVGGMVRSTGCDSPFHTMAHGGVQGGRHTDGQSRSASKRYNSVLADVLGIQPLDPHNMTHEVDQFTAPVP